jgi:hypothetical protein
MIVFEIPTHALIYLLELLLMVVERVLEARERLAIGLGRSKL